MTHFPSTTKSHAVGGEPYALSDETPPIDAAKIMSETKRQIFEIISKFLCVGHSVLYTDIFFVTGSREKKLDNVE